MSSDDLKDREKSLLGKVSLRIHPKDDMYVPVEGGTTHYLSVGLSAIRCIESIIEKTGKEEFIPSILDFPCGYGRVSRFLKVKFLNAQITAAEIDPEMVNFCKREFSAQAFISNENINKLNFTKKI